MKATILLFVFALVGMAAMVALAAEPLTPPMTHFLSAGMFEPAWMLVYGAILLVVASVVKRVGG